MCRLARIVCGGITAVVFSPRRFFDLTLLWIPLDLHGILVVLSPLGRYHRLDFRVLCGLYSCELATQTPNLENHIITFAARRYLLLLFCHLLAVFLLRLTLRDTATAHSVKGIKYP